jgi:hypothetical protein
MTDFCIKYGGQPGGWPSGDFKGLWRLLFVAFGVGLTQGEDFHVYLGGARL